MKIYNAEIADQFTKMADLLEIEGANPFRIRAYRNAARTISGLSENLADLIANNADLTELPYIGEDLASKIKQIVETGELAALKDEEKHVPLILSQLMTLEGLGPKRVKLLYDTLNIKSIQDLETALQNNTLSKIKGFGEKISQKIKQSIQYQSEYAHRYSLIEAMPIAERLITFLKKIPGIDKVEVAGSFRRRKETVGDLDVVISAKNPAQIIKKFVQYDEIREILAEGTTRSSVKLSSGIQVDIRAIPTQNYGAALFYFTGSKAHNIALRKMAMQKGLKINEYGIYKKNQVIAGKTEAEIYNTFGLAYIEPELREDNGEIAAAKKNQLPHLITLEDIRGDLHAHTNATDGANSLAAMVDAAKAKGYEYLAITDHSQHLRVANGLNTKQVFAQIKAIDRLNTKLNRFVILKSIEVDILANGELDLPNEVLKELDLTVCSIHSNFDLSQQKQTERIIRAMDNPYFNILGHPTGRLLGSRAAYQIDLDKVMLAAKERGCILEINAQPSRLDLNEIACKKAKELQVKLAISSDAHSTEQLSLLEFGIYQARRGWLEKTDIINTHPLKILRKFLQRK